MKHLVVDRPTEALVPAQMPGVSSHHIHIINPFWDASGGSEWRAISLFEGLRSHRKVSLWSEFDPDPLFLEKYPIKRIDEAIFPKTGTFIFIGTYFSIGTWIYFTCPRRVILTHNTPFVKGLFGRSIYKMSVFDLKKVEFVYASKWLADAEGYPGRIEVSPIDIDLFTPSEASDLSKNDTDDFIIGRLSRDVEYKHHPRDPAFYLELARQGFQIKVMGGMSLSSKLDSIDRITLLPACYQEPQTFLQSLDCFFYRTSEEWVEPFGRVIVEAMACGVPVVAENRGGYTQLIDHGHNGFLFRNEQEALDILLRLRNDRHLCRSIGQAARETIEELYSPARKSEIIQYYLK